MSKKNRTGKIITYTVLLFYLMWILFPFLVIIITSLTSKAEFDASMKFIWWPEELSVDGYKTILFEDIYAEMLYGDHLSSILHGFINTLWQVIPATLVGLFVSGLSAYAFAKLPFRGKDIFFGCVIVIMMIPGMVLSMPSYLFYDAIHWTDTVLPIVVPGLFGSAGVVFFLRQFIMGIPNEMLEAARVDGLNDFKIYVQIIIPLSKPAFLAQGIFMFVGGYNNYQGPLLYLSNHPELAPLQLALSLLQGGYGNPAVLGAATIIAILPLIVLYCFSQNYFTEGIAMGGLKG